MVFNPFWKVLWINGRILPGNSLDDGHPATQWFSHFLTIWMSLLISTVRNSTISNYSTWQHEGSLTQSMRWLVLEHRFFFFTATMSSTVMVLGFDQLSVKLGHVVKKVGPSASPSLCLLEANDLLFFTTHSHSHNHWVFCWWLWPTARIVKMWTTFVHGD